MRRHRHHECLRRPTAHVDAGGSTAVGCLIALLLAATPLHAQQSDLQVKNPPAAQAVTDTAVIDAGDDCTALCSTVSEAGLQLRIANTAALRGATDVRVYVDDVDVSAIVQTVAEGEWLMPAMFFAALPASAADARSVRIAVAGETIYSSHFITMREVPTPAAPGVLDQEVQAGSGASFDPRAEVTSQSQLAEGHRGDAPPPERRIYSDYNASFGFASQLQRDAFSGFANANFLAVDRRENALRFAERGDNAARVDLSDYQLGVQRQRFSAGVGHVQVSGHPFLVEGLANRGVTLSQQLSDALSVGLATVNGTPIVGYHNPFGLADRDHNIAASTLQYDGGAWQASVTGLSARIRNETGFNVGEVGDSERSRGLGARLAGNLWNGRVRGEVLYAGSRFDNPADAVLGFDATAVQSRTDEALRAEAEVDVLRGFALRSQPLDVTFRYNFERIDPLYKTVGTFVTPDTVAHALALVANYRGASLMVEARDSQDNVGDIDTILRTVTQQISVSVGLPAAFWMEAPPPWLPNVQVAVQRLHQRAGNDPDPAQSAFDGGSHLPDQVNFNLQTDLQWQFGQHGVGYQFFRARQDNRQIGRTRADFGMTGHMVNWSAPLTPALSVGLAGGRVRVEDREQSILRDTDSANANLQARFGDSWQMALNGSVARDHDSRDQGEQRQASIGAQLSKTFTLPWFADESAAGQWFVAYAYNYNESADNVFDFNSQARAWTVTAGFTVTLF